VARRFARLWSARGPEIAEAGRQGECGVCPRITRITRMAKLPGSLHSSGCRRPEFRTWIWKATPALCLCCQSRRSAVGPGRKASAGSCRLSCLTSTCQAKPETPVIPFPPLSGVRPRQQTIAFPTSPKRTGAPGLRCSEATRCAVRVGLSIGRPADRFPGPSERCSVRPGFLGLPMRPRRFRLSHTP